MPNKPNQAASSPSLMPKTYVTNAQANKRRLMPKAIPAQNPMNTPNDIIDKFIRDQA
jgi:hypothetical protein